MYSTKIKFQIQEFAIPRTYVNTAEEIKLNTEDEGENIKVL